jgi:exodeoxyribonuclease VII large subunit
VISAVGHEVDFTIADFVADRRAPTPSAAAEIVCESKDNLYRQVKSLSGRLEGALRYRLRTLRHFLDSKAGARGFAVAEAQLKRLSQRVDDLAFRLEQFGRPGNFSRERRHRIETLRHRMESVIQFRLRRAKEAFLRIAHTLDAISPLAVLERGYAVCLTPEGKVIRSADAVEVNDAIRVRVHQGILRALVSGKEMP